MNIIKITPRGYCHGVVSALNTVVKTIQEENIPKPIYILGEIVHNEMITKAFSEHDVITLTGGTRKELMDQINEGTVIITAHGIDPHLVEVAKFKNLHVVDATCTDVYRTHDLIEEKTKNGFHVLYVGKKDHPEPEGALGIDPANITLITSKEDVDEFVNSRNQKLCITNQTTMSMWDVEDIMAYAKEKFPDLEIINEICGATTERQQATFTMARDASLTLVVGDKKSNNSNKLVEVSKKLSKRPAFLISTIEEINLEWILDPDVNVVAVTSGASTPTPITQEVIRFIEQFDKEDQSTWDTTSKLPLNRIIPRVRNNKKGDE